MAKRLRLYVVRVEIEFAALAEDEDEALGFTDEAIRDTGFLEDHASADIWVLEEVDDNATDKPSMAVVPDGWDGNELVYGAGNRDITLDAAIEEERKIQDAEKQG